MVHTPRSLPTPTQLVKHGKRWTARFQAALNARSQSDWATAHAKRILRAALRDLAYGKCVFCESALEVTAYLEIEHYVAKTVTPTLAFEWTNLLPACRLCNNAKGEHDHKGALLKPDAEDPEPYFWIHSDTGRLEPHPKLNAAQSNRVHQTIQLCDLQRPALCTKRVEMLMRVLRWLSHAEVAGAEWDELSSPGLEYKFVLRHVLETRGQRALAEFDRSRFTAAPAAN
jgi:uncharacterized protein (TIGR02646 family)